MDTTLQASLSCQPPPLAGRLRCANDQNFPKEY
jgi:hypothetical protein